MLQGRILGSTKSNNTKMPLIMMGKPVHGIGIRIGCDSTGNLTSMSLTKIFPSLSSIPAQIGLLTTLTYLAIEESSVTFLPTEIGLLTALEALFPYFTFFQKP